jgi:hypothetical protein
MSIGTAPFPFVGIALDAPAFNIASSHAGSCGDVDGVVLEDEEFEEAFATNVNGIANPLTASSAIIATANALGKGRTNVIWRVILYIVIKRLQYSETLY